MLSRVLLHHQFSLIALIPWLYQFSYEGTGRSLSLKLLQQLEEQSQMSKKLDSSLSGMLMFCWLTY